MTAMVVLIILHIANYHTLCPNLRKALFQTVRLTRTEETPRSRQRSSILSGLFFLVIQNKLVATHSACQSTGRTFEPWARPVVSRQRW